MKANLSTDRWEAALDLLEQLVEEGKLVNRWQKDCLELLPAIAFLQEQDRDIGVGLK